MNAQAPSFEPSSSPSNGNRNSNNTKGSNRNNRSDGNNNKQKRRPPQKQRSYNNSNREYHRVVENLQNLDLVQAAQLTGGSTDKKGRVSLNHLLSFSFPERQEEPTYHHRKPKTVSYQPFNKERFINANFRFMLNATDNYIYQLADPDINFNWETIEQVLISSSEKQSCPICLSSPTAARVTKCGHIFCLPCILHYLELRENSKRLWRKCPICWDAIYQADLKPVRILKPFAVTGHPTATPKASLACGVTEGDRISMCLIQRASSSTLAFPLSDTWPLPPNVISNYIKPETPIIPWHFSPAAMEFARFMLASPGYLQEEYGRDLIELEEMEKDAHGWGSTEEIPFIESASKLTKEAIKKIKALITKEIALAVSTEEMMIEAVQNYSKKHGKRSQQPKSAFEEKGAETNVEEVPEAYRQLQLHQAGGVDNHEHATTADSASSNKPVTHINHKNAQQDNVRTTDFYFYQAVDGQHIYLHPLDIRILKHEFGEYENFPRKLQVRATSVQESTLTEDLRKKCKYLAHLPLACDVTFLEINVKEIVSPETIQVFNHELSARTKRRLDKERREDQDKKYAESKHKFQIAKEQESERHMLQNDPFFNMYRPSMTEEESEEQLNLALSESAASLSSNLEDEPVIPSAHAGGSNLTVWGTRQITPREEDLMENNMDWADHIVINKSHRKRRGKKH